MTTAKEETKSAENGVKPDSNGEENKDGQDSAHGDDDSGPDYTPRTAAQVKQDKAVKRRLSAANAHDEIEDLIAELGEDTPVQKVSMMLKTFQITDSKRAEESYLLKLAKDAGSKDEASTITKARRKTLERLAHITSDLIKYLADDDCILIREEPNNWAGWPVKLCPILVNRLKAKPYQIDCSPQWKKAQEIQAQDDKIRAGVDSEVGDDDDE